MSSENYWAKKYSGGGGGSSRRSSSSSGNYWADKYGKGTAAQVKPKDSGGSSLLDIGPIKALRDFAGDTGNAVMKGLSALDIPRAAIVATGNEVMDIFDGDSRQGGARIQDSSDGFSISDIIANTKNHIGVGDVLEQRGGDDLNPWLKRGLGFVGDVALDPLTYVTFGAVKGAQGGARVGGRMVSKNEVVRRLLDVDDDAARRITGADDVADARDGIREIANNVLNDRSTSRLPKAAADELGFSVGVNFAGRTLPKTQPLADFVSRGTGKAKRKAWDAAAARMKPETWMRWERIPGFRLVAQRTDQVNAFKYGTAKVDSITDARNFKTEFQQDFGRMLTEHEGADWTIVRDMIEHGAVGGDTAEAAAAEATQRLLGKLRRRFNKDTGKTLPDWKTYFPRVVTDEFKELVGNSGRLPSDAMKKRILTEGAEFLGETTTGTVDDIQRIAIEKFGDDALQIFSDDPQNIFRWYLIAMEREYEKARWVKLLNEYGVKGVEDIAEASLRLRKANAAAGTKSAAWAARRAASEERKATKKFNEAADRRAKGQAKQAEAEAKLAEAEQVADDLDLIHEWLPDVEAVHTSALVDLDAIPEAQAGEFGGLPQSAVEPAEAATVAAADIARQAEVPGADVAGLQGKLAQAQEGKVTTVSEDGPVPADAAAAAAAARETVEGVSERLRAVEAEPIGVARRSVGADVPASQRRAGTYYAIGDDADYAGELIRGQAAPANALIVKPGRRTWGDGLPTSAGEEAARRLLSPEDFDMLVNAAPEDAVRWLESRYDLDLSSMSRTNDFTQKVLEVAGAQEAKRAGHDAIVMSGGEWPEMAVLTDDVVSPLREVTETVEETVPATSPEQLQGLRDDLAGTTDELSTVRAAAKEQARRIRDHDSFVADPANSKKSLLRGAEFDEATPILDDYPSLAALQDLDPVEQLEHAKRLIDELPERHTGKLKTAVKQVEERAAKTAATETGDTAEAYAKLQATLLGDLDADLAEGFVTRTEYRKMKQEIEQGQHASLQTLRGTSKEKQIDAAVAGKSESAAIEKELDNLHTLYDEGLEQAEKARVREAEQDWLRAEVKQGDLSPEAQAELKRRRRQALRDLQNAKVDVAKAWQRKRSLQAAIKDAAKGDVKVKRVITKMVPDTKVRNDRIVSLREELVEAEQQLAAAKAKAVPTKVKREVRKVNEKKVADLKAELGRATRRKRYWDDKLAKAQEVEAAEWNGLSSLETAGHVRASELREAMTDRWIDAQNRLTNAKADRGSLLEMEVEARAAIDQLLDDAVKLEAKGQKHLAEAAKVEALALDRQATAGLLKANADSTFISPSLTAKEMQQLADIKNGKLVQFATKNGIYADKEMVDLIDSVWRLQRPDAPGALAKAWDTVQSRWKAQALLSPGYHMRNSQTAVFMNWLAGMETKRYGQFAPIWRRLIKAQGDPDKIEAVFQGIKNKELREGMRTTYKMRGAIFGESGVDANAEILMQQGFGSGGLMRGGPDSIRGKWLDPTSLEWRPYKWNFKTAGAVERTIRGPLFLDGLMKGMTPDEALQRVVLHHFDYSDLSYMETKYLKRAIPFYTWTRKNIPVMMEYMARKPGGFMWYLHAQRNLEMGVPEDEVVPGYFMEAGAIRTPFAPTGDRLYAAPDLPFLNLNEAVDSGTLLGQVSPIIKLPYEVSANKRTFKDIPFTNKVQKVPDSWDWLMYPLMAVSGEAGMPTVIRRDGEFLMTDKDLYKIEQAQPLLGRIRRLLPSEELYSDRRFTTVLSTIFGFGSFTNGERQQEGELLSREFAQRDAITKENQIQSALNPTP